MYHDLFQKFDVIYVKYLNDAKHACYLLAARDYYGKKLVTDFDDDVFNIDHSNFAWEFYKDRQHCFKIWELMAQGADVVTVSTERLKKEMGKYNKNVVLIPNAFDFSIYENRPKNNKKIRIMWAGSISHEPDLAMIAPVLRDIQKKYGNKIEIFIVGGYDSDSLAGLDYTFMYGTRFFTEYPALLSKINPDITIAPLEDIPFNHSKSCIKWYEMTAIGAPVVASDLTPYKVIENGVTGFLAKTHHDWIKYLSRLIESKELREETVKNATEEIKKNHSVEKVKPLWEEALS